MINLRFAGFFPVDSVPTDDVLELSPDSYKEYLKPLEEHQKLNTGSSRNSADERPYGATGIDLLV